MLQPESEYRRLLGVDESAGIKELRKAFHVRAGYFHPDVRRNDPGAEEEFKRITTAYHYLKKEILKANRKKKEAADPANAAGAARSAASLAGERKIKVAQLPGIPVPPEELVYRLRFSQNRHVRMHALREIAKHGSKSTLWWVIGALKDPDSEVRRVAVLSLGEIGSAVALAPLKEAWRGADAFLKDEIEKTIKKMERSARTAGTRRSKTAS